MNYLVRSLFGILVTASFLAYPVQVQAADVFQKVCTERPNSAVCKDASNTSSSQNDNPIFGVNGVLTKIVDLITIIVGIAAVLSIILGGIKFLTSGNSPQEVTTAREMILYALVGVVLAALAQAIVRLFIVRLLG